MNLISRQADKRPPPRHQSAESRTLRAYSGSTALLEPIAARVPPRYLRTSAANPPIRRGRIDQLAPCASIGKRPKFDLRTLTSIGTFLERNTLKRGWWVRGAGRRGAAPQIESQVRAQHYRVIR
jgi:hypothetical protein